MELRFILHVAATTGSRHKRHESARLLHPAVESINGRDQYCWFLLRRQELFVKVIDQFFRVGFIFCR